MYKLLLLAAFVFITTTGTAQTPNAQSVKYSGDKYLLDTIPGMAMIADSCIRMVASASGFRYEKVMAPIMVDVLLIKQYRFLVRASDGGTDPFDMTESFHLRTGGLLDPRRVLLFNQFKK